MWKDPIVEEIHAVREQIARECNYELGEIFARLRMRQKANAERIVRKEDLAKRKAGVDEQDREVLSR
jgi:putative heme iron utilization protein